MNGSQFVHITFYTVASYVFEQFNLCWGATIGYVTHA
jgi:hypothetical protein